MEVVRFPARGGFSVRSIFVFALTVIITAILWATFTSTPTQAQSANWTDGGTILHDGHSYNAATDITDPTGSIPSGAKIYKSTVQPGTGATPAKIFIIYFGSGTSPPTETSAQFVEFDYNGGRLSNPQNARSITLTPQGSTDGLAGEVETSCAVGGIGWIICPMSVFLAEAMDNLFNILAGMIAVQPPVLGDQNNSMYVAWNVMRSIANVAFVIVFLIIIFSQVTSMGVSNYGLKRLVPRLIIAAVLVNISFYIAAAAIDISNIAGYSVQAIFNGIRENIFQVTNDNLSGVNTNTWAAVTAVILAGGGAIGGVVYMANGGLYLLVPLLIGLALTVLFVVVIFAARQAIILILVIIAPLAFVANLLPNTEKWFDKWKDLFFTMLIFFPAFALVFGGSQLAGQIIIQNAGDNIITLLFGMAVQIAPLVITPLILKLSGGLLGRIAQITNNPRKGVIDRSRNWAEKRAEHAKWQNHARGARWYNPSSYGAGLARRAEERKRRLSDNTDIWKQAATNRYEQSPKYEAISERKEGVELDKKAIHSHHARHIDRIKSGQSTVDKQGLYARAIKAESSEEDATTAKNQVTSHYNDLRVRGSSALRASSYNLEMSKVRLEGSENAKNAYFTNQKADPGTRLGALVDEFETTKVRLEGAQSRYAARVDTIKTNPTTTLNGAVQTAQTAKQQAETAQVKLQAYFDAQNANPTTVMGASYVELERAKISGEGIKARLSEYTAEMKSTGGTLHGEFIETERVKLRQQNAEGAITRIVEEYKGGGKQNAAGDTLINGTTITPFQQSIIDDMRESTARIAGEQQGTTSAKYVQQSYISELMDSTSPTALANPTLAADVLETAAGIDPNGEIRAQANAVTQLDKLKKEALGNGVTLLGDRAEKQGTTIKALAKEVFARHVGEYEDPITKVLQPRQQQDPSILEAALEALAQDGDIPTMRKARMSGLVDQSMMTSLLARNATTMKVKGGFDLQNDPSLAGASQERMNASIAANLGSTAASNYPDMKNGEIISTQKNIAQILLDADSAPDPKVRADAQEGLQKAYVQVSLALTDGRIRERLGDNLIPAIEIHKALDARFMHNPKYRVDHNSIDPRTI